ncbi:PLDc N-terminal domain-containing protein [Microbacterium sp. NPDC058345]|uniref:PLDc N-terminal domain-containing protein n=1 Tax=Microbacterium sp. NPDC058345 TaxID=3346455 RepID=UPI00365DD843
MGFLIWLVTLALTVFSLVDIIRRDDSQVKHMPKFVWLLLVVLLPLIGSVLWFAIGREYPENGIQLGRAPRQRTAPSPQPAAPPVRVDTRSTEEQIADLDREIEEWRLRQEIEKRKHQRGESSDSGTHAE